MASRKFGIVAAWLAATASTAMLAVPAASGAWRTPVVNRSSSTSDFVRSAERCRTDRAWTHVPADSRQATVGSSGTHAVETAVLVGVPRTAVMRVDADGRVIAAWTNTGCPPRAGDELWLHRSSGELERTAEVSLVVRSWTGAFSVAGVWEPQPATSEG